MAASNFTPPRGVRVKPRDASEDRHIWSKWFWSDWRADAGIEACSWAARGLWIECLALMAKAEKRGYLLVGGVKPNDKLLLKLTRGSSKAELRRCLVELTQHQVCSWTPEGVMFSRRMVRDTAQSARNSANGKHGGSPLLINSRLTESDNREQAREVNRTSKPYIPEPEARSQKPEDQGQEPSAQTALAPRWTQTPSRRTSALVSTHRGCFEGTPAACARGICVPGWLGNQWRQQYGDDLVAADCAIADVVGAALAALPPTGPIGDEPKKFWPAVWLAAHGSQAPATGTAKTKGVLTLDAAKRVALARMERAGRAS